MRPWARRFAVTLVLFAGLTAGIAAPAGGQSDTSATVMHVVLEADGDARWTVSARFTLADANDTAAFERMATEYVTGEADLLSAEPYRTAAAQASEVAGRPMLIENVTRGAGRTNLTGELRLSFTWSSFARVTSGGERLVLGDVFSTPSGTWLPGLRDGQVLIIEFPDGFVVESVSRGLDNGSIRVAGPEDFDPGQPSAILERGGPVVTSPPSPTPQAGVPSALSIGAAMAILLVAGYLVYRRQETDEEPPSEEPAAPEAPEEPPPDTLLSDEEFVLQLLEAEGGRMKQVDIVEETDWSNAKVSQLLSSMAEAGQIEKLRIGRENLISLPDDDE